MLQKKNKTKQNKKDNTCPFLTALLYCYVPFSMNIFFFFRDILYLQLILWTLFKNHFWTLRVTDFKKHLSPLFTYHYISTIAPKHIYRHSDPILEAVHKSLVAQW